MASESAMIRASLERLEELTIARWGPPGFLRGHQCLEGTEDRQGAMEALRAFEGLAADRTSAAIEDARPGIAFLALVDLLDDWLATGSTRPVFTDSDRLASNALHWALEQHEAHNAE